MVKTTSSTLSFLDSLQAPTREIVALPINEIRPDPKQPRTSFHATDGMVDQKTQEALEELAADIAANGLHQPISVREVEDGYMIVMGERRWRAMRLNNERGVPNSETIDCIIRQDLENEKLPLAQLAENLQREDLSDLETAAFLRRVLDDFPELQKQQLGKILGKGSQYVSRILALLDPKWSHVIDSGIITYASLLEQYRALPEEKRDALVKLAKSEQRQLTSGDIKAARKGSLSHDLINEVSKITDAQKPEGETYVYQPSAAVASEPASVKVRNKQIVDHGGEATIPTGAKALNPSMLEKRELKLTISQLDKLLQRVRISNGGYVFSGMMPVEEMKAMLKDLGGDVPVDDSVVPLALAQRLNEL